MPQTPTAPIPIPSPARISTPLGTYTITLEFSPWSFPRLFLARFGTQSPHITRSSPPPPLTSRSATYSEYAGSPMDWKSDHTTPRASRYSGYSGDTTPIVFHHEEDSDNGSDISSEEGEDENHLSHYANSDKQVSLLYTTRHRGNSPRLYRSSVEREDEDLMLFETPAPRARPSNRNTPDSVIYPEDSVSQADMPRPPLSEYHLEVPSLYCLWRIKWTLLVLVSFLWAWAAVTCGMPWNERWVLGLVELVLLGVAAGGMRGRELEWLMG